MSSAPPPPAYQAPTPMNPADEKLWATLIHIGGIIFGFVPALIGYIVLKERGPFIRAHSLTALNFQISLLIYALGILIIGVVTLGLGFVLYAPLGIVAVIFMILAAIKANEGQYYSYPLTIKFIS
ncbi:MAG: DUF4870 domain-containing protein [Cryobacterium sp.]